MKYWNYPTVGSGFHYYNDPHYGVQSANFGATTYQWGSMPNAVFSANNAVATLMYHCGVSVEMGYGTAATGGSSAYVISRQSAITHCAEYAYKNYFGYKTTLQGIEKSNFTNTQWISKLKAEFDSSRPVLYCGFGNGGHCFVADGYDNNDFIHFNWGWGGAGPDDYLSVTAIIPASQLGTGGGNGGGYTNGQQAIIGIQPPAYVPTYLLKLYNNVLPSSPTITFGQAFSISTNITNNGTATFSGDYCAAVFDSSGIFVDYVEIKSGQSLQNGYHYTNDLVFSNSGMAKMMPGSYTVGIYNRPAGGQWSLVANGSYNNFAKITVTYTNSIALNSAINVSPSTFIQGQAASVNFNIKNIGTSAFYGKYYTALYNLDGTFAQLIDSVNATAGLPAGYTYISPFLTFKTFSVMVSPGTYLLAVFHEPTGGTSQLTGANFFQNPIKVIVKAPDLVADIYEVNNIATQAASLSVSFSGNNAKVNTVGSNCHLGNDYDYYKISLPAGYCYQINPRLQDSYSSNNGIAYTLDAVFSYSFDSTNWSQGYDDTLNSSVILNNGGTVYFSVAPYFSGNVGTYLLDINLTRTVCPLPIISLTGSVSSCSANLTTLTSNSPSGNQWYLNNIAIANATNNTYTPTTSGVYTLVTTVNGCTSSPSPPVSITVNSTPLAPALSTSSATNLCQGSNVTLSSSAASGNQWYNNGNAITGATGTTYVATIAGAYTVVATSGTCSSTVSNSVSITVNALPASTITAAGATSFCSGGSVVLNANTGTGLTYQWKKDGVNINGATAVSYTATNTGGYSVVVTNSSNCSSTSSTTQVTVNSTPNMPTASASGATSLCQGGNVTLSSSAASGNQWYNNGNAITGATGTTHVVSTAGVYTVIAASGNCSSSVSNSVSVTVNALPASTVTAVGATNFCPGGSVMLNANTGTGLIYQWRKDGSNVSGATNSSYTATAAGDYTVIVTNSSACSTISNAIQVMLNASPSIPSINWNGTQLSTTVTGVTYQWYINGNAIAGANSPIYTPTSIGTYQLQVTASGCTTISDNFSLVVTGIDPTLTLSPYTAQVYPNPASNDFAIKFGAAPQSTVEIQLVNNLGLVIKSLKTKQQLTTMKVNELASGVYYIKIIGGNYNQTKKLQIINQQ